MRLKRFFNQNVFKFCVKFRACQFCFSQGLTDKLSTNILLTRLRFQPRDNDTFGCHKPATNHALRLMTDSYFYHFPGILEVCLKKKKKDFQLCTNMLDSLNIAHKCLFIATIDIN